MRQLAISTIALALGTAAALGLASCGGGEDAKLLPGNTAAEITENLDLVQQYAEEEECVGAENAVSDINSQIEGLTGVDPKLVEALQRGAARLSEVVAGCEEETEAVAPSSEATTEEETEKTPPGLEKKEEKEREKEEKALEKEEEKAEKHEPPAVEKTTPEEAPTTPVPPPSEAGGTGAPGGVSPGTPAAPEQGNE